MITRVLFRRFKSIEDVEFELGRVNVLIGANGSGKSNLLEALGVLSAAAAGRVDEEALERRGVRRSVPALFQSAFPGVEPYDVTMTLNAVRPPRQFFAVNQRRESSSRAITK
jgi:recombinational DNA repair ATPase RecF